MLTEEIKIPTDNRPIEAFVMSKKPHPDKAFMILPGRGYTINHFLLDFLWRMAAEQNYYSIKAEYRGFTYRHFDEPYDHEYATIDARYVVDYLKTLGYPPEKVVACGKSLGSIAVGNLVIEDKMTFDKAILLTPVLYVQKDKGVFPTWKSFCDVVPKTFLAFGSADEYCDLEAAQDNFPGARIEYFDGADHGLLLPKDYARSIEINRQIIECVKEFIR